MLQTEYETMLALDSCAVIGTIRSSGFATKIIRLFRGKYCSIVLQDIVLQECKKILKTSRDEIISKIQKIIGKEVFVFETASEIKENARRIEQQYGICHFPDSIILEAAKTCTWTILTTDKNMLRVAHYEGIQAFNPKRSEVY